MFSSVQFACVQFDAVACVRLCVALLGSIRLLVAAHLRVLLCMCNQLYPPSQHAAQMDHDCCWFFPPVIPKSLSCSGPVADPGHPRMARATHG